MDSLNLTRNVIFAAALLALNVGLGKAANMLGLPLAMDTVGTILAAALLRWPWVLAVACLSSVLASIVIHPAFLFFMGTQIAIALAAMLLMRLHGFAGPVKAVIAGLIIGIVSAVVSAPVTAIVFGGIATPSITALNAVFLAAGNSLWKSVLQGALLVESIDKMIAGLIVWLTLRRLPHLTHEKSRADS